MDKVCTSSNQDKSMMDYSIKIIRKGQAHTILIMEPRTIQEIGRMTLNMELESIIPLKNTMKDNGFKDIKMEVPIKRINSPIKFILDNFNMAKDQARVD